MANTAEATIRCADHLHVAGQTPDEEETLCENVQAKAAINAHLIADLSEYQENARNVGCPKQCMCNQSVGKYFAGKGTHSNHPLVALSQEIHKHDGCCTSANKIHMTHLRFGKCNLSANHNGDCICYTCESDFVALARDRREQAYPVDKEAMCGKHCDCDDMAHPGCCKVPDYRYNDPCCLTIGHDTIGTTGVSSKNHLFEPCRTHYIEKHYDLLYAGGEFPCGPQAALTPRDFVSIYPASFKIPVVEGDPGFVHVEPDAWDELS